MQALSFLYPLNPNAITCIKQLCIIYTSIAERKIFLIVLPTVVCVSIMSQHFNVSFSGKVKLLGSLFSCGSVAENMSLILSLLATSLTYGNIFQALKWHFKNLCINCKLCMQKKYLPKGPYTVNTDSHCHLIETLQFDFSSRPLSVCFALPPPDTIHGQNVPDEETQNGP